MKYDLTKKLTIGATRTLFTLQQAMLSLLTEKCFEEISVQKLCDKTMLPRATFYNYFDDKYDLLDYCLLCIHKKMDVGYSAAESCQHRLNALTENFIDFFDQNIDTVQRILTFNRPNQYFINQIRRYLADKMMEAFKQNANTHLFKVPQELAAKGYSVALLTILEWKYLDQKECGKEQAKQYLQWMLSGLDQTANSAN